MAVADIYQLSHMPYNEGCQLIAGESGDCPRGEGDAMNGADILHTIVVGQQCGYIAEAAAVACVYHKQQHQNQNQQQSALPHVRNAFGQNYQASGNDGQDDHNLIHSISVLHGICPCGEAQAAACVKYGGNGGQYPGHACQADTFDNHFFLGDQCQTTGDVDVEHQPDADEHHGLGLDNIDGSRPFLLRYGLMPACGLGQQQMAHKHHNKVYTGQNQEHLVDAAFPQGVQQRLHDGACDGLGGAETSHCQSRCQTFAVLEPQHQGFDRGEIACAQADTHDETVADIDADQCQRAVLMGTAVPDEEAGSCHP